MKELSRTELRRIVATEVYKNRYSHNRRDGVECMYTETYDADLSVFSCCKCGYTEIFEPDTDANQATDALKAYGHEFDIEYKNHMVKRDEMGYRVQVGKLSDGNDAYHSDDLTTAICLALASALTGETYTLKEELSNEQ